MLRREGGVWRKWVWLDYVVRNQLLSSCLFLFVKPIESCILFLSFVVLLFWGSRESTDRFVFCIVSIVYGCFLWYDRELGDAMKESSGEPRVRISWLLSSLKAEKHSWFNRTQIVRYLSVRLRYTSWQLTCVLDGLVSITWKTGSNLMQQVQLLRCVVPMSIVIRCYHNFCLIY